MNFKNLTQIRTIPNLFLKLVKSRIRFARQLMLTISWFRKKSFFAWFKIFSMVSRNDLVF